MSAFGLTVTRPALRRIGAVIAVAATAAALSLTSAPFAAADSPLDQPTLQQATFGWAGSVQNWTVPGDPDTAVVLMISMTGGQGGRGGYDTALPIPGGYVGAVTGSLTVPGGTVLQIAVGGGGREGADGTNSNTAGGAGGTNPLGGYSGGQGGRAGSSGSSGAGGGGGAATVVTVDGHTLVAAGAGGGGGSGNGGATGFLKGRAAEAGFDPDQASGNSSGTAGISAPTTGAQTDGGGGGGGGGGATGGAGGRIEYGEGTTKEWFGYGGFPGSNGVDGYATLTGSYQYYPGVGYQSKDDGLGNGAAGSVTVRYVDGAPAAPRNVIGRSGSDAGSIDVKWDEPINPGFSEITGYEVQYREHGGDTWTVWPAAFGAGDRATTLTGLEPSTQYDFEVRAVNGRGDGLWSNPSAAIAAASGAGGAVTPWATSGANGTGAENAHIVPGDGSLSVTWDDGTAPDVYTVHVYDAADQEVSGSPKTCHDDDDCTITGLTNGSDYTVALETPGERSLDVMPYQEEGSNTQPGWAHGLGAGATITRNPDGSITVDWPAPAVPPADDYLMYVYTLDGVGALGSPFPCTGEQGCTSGALNDLIGYTVSLEAPYLSDRSPVVQPVGPSEWSEPQDGPMPSIAAPTGLAVTGRDSALSLAFTAPTVAEGNAILYYEYSLDGGDWQNSGAFASPAVISGLTNGVSYQVKVRAMTLNGPGDASTGVTGTPMGYPTPRNAGAGNPAGITATAAGLDQGTVSWTAFLDNGAAVDDYIVAAFDAPTEGSVIATMETGSGSTLTANLTIPIATVYLTVQARNSVGWSPRTSPRVRFDRYGVPPGQAGVPALADGALTWSPASGDVSGYDIQYSTDNGLNWTTVSPSSGPTTQGSTVTAGISSLPGAGTYVLRVRGTAGAAVGPWSPASDPVTVSAPLVPALDSAISTPGGFTTQVTNYDDDLAWSATSTQGSATIDGSGLVTVTGLSASQSATVTVTATGFGTGGRSGSTTGTALGGTAPVLGTPTPTAGGFTVQIANWALYEDGGYGTHTVFTPVLVANPDGVTPSYSGPDGDGLITVTGVGDAHQITLAYQVVSDTHTAVTGESVVGASLLAAVIPTFSATTRTEDGFSVTIANFDSSGPTAYDAGVDAGSVSGPDDHGVIVVSGLVAGQSATLTVTTQASDHLPGGATVTGTALAAGTPPAFGDVSRLAGGFTTSVTIPGGYAPGTKASVVVSGGAIVACGGESKPNGPVACGTGQTVTVSGAGSGAVVTVTAILWDAGHTESTKTVTGQALFAGVEPTFGDYARTSDGFTVGIGNWDIFKGAAASGDPSAEPRTGDYVAAGTTVTVSVTGLGGSQPVVRCGNSGPSSVNGTVTCGGGSGSITVTGLTSSQQATVAVTVVESDGNHLSATGSWQGQALAEGIPPTFVDGVSLRHGFTVRIANYDASSSYTVTATEGSSGTGAAIAAENVTFDSTDGTVTVSGLADGSSATVDVSVATAGRLDAHASHTGVALKTPVTPVLAITANNAAGFTARIVNWDAFSVGNYGSGTSFVPVGTPQGSDPAPTVTGPDPDGRLTVTDVPTGHSASLTVTVRQAEHPDATSEPVTGTALYPGVAPTLGTPTRTADGFRVPIANYALYTAAGGPTVDGDDGSAYGDAGQFAVTVTAVSTGGTALGDVRATVLQPAGVLQVTGLAFGQFATVTLTAGDGLSRHQDATSDPVEGQALLAAIKASFGQVTATLNSIAVRIANFDSDTNYTISSSAGVVSRSGSVITVTGLAPGQDATITVATTTPGHVQGISSTSGTTLRALDQPGSSPAVQREGGFSARITPFDKDASYTAAVSGAPGASVSVSGDTVTVSGMKPGDTVTVTITQTKDGYAPVTTTITYTLPQPAGDQKDPSGGATPPGVPELKPGETSVTVNGVPVPSQTSVGSNGVTVTWQGMTMTAVHMVDGQPVPPDPDGDNAGQLTVPFTGSVKVDVSGFAPGSSVQLWAFSTPTLLGTFTSQPDARGIITVDLPLAVIVGDHTLVAAGVNREGEHVTMSTAMRVTPLAVAPGAPDPEATAGREEIAYTGTQTFDELRIAAGLLVVGMGLIGLTYRRRRTDPALAQVGVAGGFGPEPESAGPVVVASGTWKRPADAGPAAAAVSAAMTALPSLGDVAGVLDGLVPDAAAVALPAIPAQRTATDAGAAPVGPAPAAPAAESARKFIAPRHEPSLEWMSLRFSLGLTQG